MPQPQRGGVWHDFSLRSTTATFVYLPPSAVVIRFETALALRTREKGWDESDPPQKWGGHAVPKRGALWHTLFGPNPCLASDPMMTWRTWGVPVRCGVGMVALQTLLALYRFGDTTALLQLVNPLMWIGLGLFFVTGWLIGWVVERLLRGTTGRFRTLLLGATILATPVAVAGSLVGGLFGPPGVLIYGLIPYLLLVGIPRLIGKGWAVWTRHGS